MRYSLIHRRALLLDQFIDAYKRVHRRRTFPRQQVSIVLRLLFPGSSVAGRGAFKTVHKVSARVRDLVLKTSARKNIRMEERAYKRLPPTVRNRYFAKVYWRTKYCLPQKFGSVCSVQPSCLARLRQGARKYGLTDLRPGNIRCVGSVGKIVDVTVTSRGVDAH
jgi:hypothetical protein